METGTTDEASKEVADFIVNEDGKEYVSDETTKICKQIAKHVKNEVKENYRINSVTNSTKTNDVKRAIKLMVVRKYTNKLYRDIREGIMELLVNLVKINFDVLY